MILHLLGFRLGLIFQFISTYTTLSDSFFTKKIAWLIHDSYHNTYNWYCHLIRVLDTRPLTFRKIRSVNFWKSQFLCKRMNLDRHNSEIDVEQYGLVKKVPHLETFLGKWDLFQSCYYFTFVYWAFWLFWLIAVFASGPTSNFYFICILKGNIAIINTKTANKYW